MFSSTRLFVVACLVATSVLLLAAPMAKATYMSPVAVPYHSTDGLSWGGTDRAAEAAIVGLYRPGTGTDTKNAYMDDDTSPYSDPLTGYFVFDLGQAYTVNAGQVWSRESSSPRFAKNVDFFRFLDGSPQGFTDSSYIASDTDVALIAPNTDLTNASATATDVTFTSPIIARYVGLRLNSSYNDVSDGCSMIGEVRFDVGPVPEPSMIILLGTGLIGLLAYAWRKRK
jgi:hypothetical protein